MYVLAHSSKEMEGIPSGLMILPWDRYSYPCHIEFRIGGNGRPIATTFGTGGDEISLETLRAIFSPEPIYTLL